MSGTTCYRAQSGVLLRVFWHFYSGQRRTAWSQVTVSRAPYFSDVEVVKFLIYLCNTWTCSLLRVKTTNSRKKHIRKTLKTNNVRRVLVQESKVSWATALFRLFAVLVVVKSLPHVNASSLSPPRSQYQLNWTNDIGDINCLCNWIKYRFTIFLHAIITRLPLVPETFLARFLVASAHCVVLRPTPKIPTAREKNLWYPGYHSVAVVCLLKHVFSDCFYPHEGVWGTSRAWDSYAALTLH